MVVMLDETAMRTCQNEKCGVRYLWKKSPSSLKMTYCGSFCEQAHLGYHLNDFISQKIEMVVKLTPDERAALDALAKEFEAGPPL